MSGQKHSTLLSLVNGEDRIKAGAKDVHKGHDSSDRATKVKGHKSALSLRMYSPLSHILTANVSRIP